MLTVVTPATSAALVSLEAAKAELGLPAADTSQDETLRRVIGRASTLIARHCNQVFARETLRETFRASGREVLILARSPASIAHLCLDGQELDPEGWELDGRLLRRLHGGWLRHWSGHRVVVDYAAGYQLPDQPADPAAPPLPLDLEHACLQLLTALREAAGRDPMLRSLSMPDALSQSWLDPRAGAAHLPPQVAEALAPHVRHVFA
jgi:hypothetical protein